eukprot:4497719-Pleurochrysis_carterae.AAC.1
MSTPGTQVRTRRRQRRRTDETIHNQKAPLTLLNSWFGSRRGNQTTSISDTKSDCAKHQKFAASYLRKPPWPAR